MTPDELTELHFITAIENIPTIMEHGILCHKEAERLPHKSIAMNEIQDKRATKVVPGGRPLHEYANLYICARNPMLFKRKDQHESLCVLRIDKAIALLSGVVVADQNAASKYALFDLYPGGLVNIDRDTIFAEYWVHEDDQIETWRHSSMKCAEILVPNSVPAKYIGGAYVSGVQAKEALEGLCSKIPITMDPHLFFL